MICAYGLILDDGLWRYSGEERLKKGHQITELLTNIDDLKIVLEESGIEKNLAEEMAIFVSQGNASKGRSLWKHFRDKYKDLNEKWAEYRKIMEEHKIPEWYIRSCENAKDVYSKETLEIIAQDRFRKAYFKFRYPKAFYEAYFKIEAIIYINNYYCKAQVKRELNKLYDEKEIYKYHDDNKIKEEKINEKIADLEILLEAYEGGFFEEKGEIDDDYNLINSRAISDYCREIGHKFNTEELAVLVYRNRRMDIQQKIDKYKDLIENYLDMEVIERINCKHYDSVKTMIQEEIDRLEKLHKELLEDNGNSIYEWDEYNKSTKKWGRYNDFEEITKTYDETYKKAMDYIDEYDDTWYVKITKKSFDEKNTVIYAYYSVIDKKMNLYDIVKKDEDFHESIDQILLNIPTPFKKGDILVVDNTSLRNSNDDSDVFVLDYLITWNKNIEERMKKGNYDSSDMIGYGYYFTFDHGFEITCDDKWDYDSFEYYEGKLEYRERFLKAISSLLKGKIGIELFLQAYERMKQDTLDGYCEYHTEEGLKLCGFSDFDIAKMKTR